MTPLQTEKSFTLTAVDVFCGAGGASEGMRQEGVKILLGIDIWPLAAQTFSHNQDAPCWQRDMLTQTASVERIEEIPDSSILTGSPPCVSFSNSNRSGKADKRLGKKLVKAYLKLVAVKKHKPGSQLVAWFMENVGKSAAHLQDKYRFKDLDLGLWAETIGKRPDDVALDLRGKAHILSSADYGCAQARKRLFVGELITTNRFDVPPRTHGEHLKPYLTLGEVIKKLPAPCSEQTNLIQSITDPVYENWQLPPQQLSDHFYDTGLPKHLWERSKFLKTNHPFMGRMAFPENLDKPCRTVMATFIGCSRESIILRCERRRTGNGQYRGLTIREAACLMGFPIFYQFFGNEPNKLKQVGNAVCPHVTRALALEVKRSLGIPTTDKPIAPIIRSTVIENLNSFEKAKFKKQKPGIKGARFRSHLFKVNGLTVELSNFDVLAGRKSGRKWRTAVFYSIGAGFETQAHEVTNISNRALERELRFHLPSGDKFIDAINNGFSERIPRSYQTAQMLVERKLQDSRFDSPHVLVRKVGSLINKFKGRDSLTDSHKLPLKKSKLAVKQIMAIYAFNKIARQINSGS
jgi:DNA (cytosine-5)-methyltransferase 1